MDNKELRESFLWFVGVQAALWLLYWLLKI